MDSVKVELICTKCGRILTLRTEEDVKAWKDRIKYQTCDVDNAPLLPIQDNEITGG